MIVRELKYALGLSLRAMLLLMVVSLHGQKDSKAFEFSQGLYKSLSLRVGEDHITYDTNGNLISPAGGWYNVLSNDSVIQCPNVLVPAVLGANANVLFTPIAPTNPNPFSLLASTGVVYLQSTGGDDLTEGDYLLPYMICDAQNPTHCITTGVWITLVAASPFTGTINSGQNEQYKHSNQPLISEKNGLQIINFPDPNLKARLLSGACCSDYPLNTTTVVDLNGDGEVDTTEASKIGAMNLSACNISNLMGLQYFTNLLNLWFPSNPISVLDYTVLPSGLQYFGPYNIPIHTIDTSHFPNLNVLNISGTQISDLDLETNHALNLLILKNCPNISSVILKNGSVQDVSDTTNGCWLNCPNLVSVCTDANELVAVESFLTTCGYNLSLMNVNSSCVLGTQGFTNEGGFSVAPNPSKGVFELRFSESIEGSVSVYTILGQRIVYTELNGTVLGLQLSDYPSGSYMIVVESGNKVMHQMVVKE
ncbi:T9SS type A sorting domain-containing protein [Flavobacterium sp. SUN046]|uniref:T9SS type A sorting domain-containing protein n=1 Tax=Flavobacterium sp. SUN046 TaxID=3002440 RepID=UPI002DB97E84|nr:T9SS type A sorting domain-containing protein [Flavobacterium sp. SUN046]MEC4049044.1 T9SS type A sorting domain-containing protein [Flavobacterium sp. SUN046]